MNKIADINTPAADVQSPDVMPHSIEAEQQLLGAILTNNDIYDRVASIIKPEHFFDPVHARIFEVAAARIAKNNLASPVTLNTFLQDDEGLAELGGAAYLARLAASAIAGFAVRDYAQMIYDLAIRRELIQLGQDISSRATKADVEQEPKDQIIEAEQALYKLGEDGQSDSGFQSFLRAVTSAVDVANNAYKREGGLAGVATQLIDMDKKLGEIVGLEISNPTIKAHRMEMTRWSLAPLTEETGVSTVDFANRLADFGIDPYWMSHEPWIVAEPFTPEAGELWSKEDIDMWIGVIAQIVEEARTNPEFVKTAPHNQAIAQVKGDAFEDPAKWAMTWRAYKRKVQGISEAKGVA